MSLVFFLLYVFFLFFLFTCVPCLAVSLYLCMSFSSSLSVSSLSSLCCDFHLHLYLDIFLSFFLIPTRLRCKRNNAPRNIVVGCSKHPPKRRLRKSNLSRGKRERRSSQAPGNGEPVHPSQMPNPPPSSPKRATGGWWWLQWGPASSWKRELFRSTCHVRKWVGDLFAPRPHKQVDCSMLPSHTREDPTRIPTQSSRPLMLSRKLCG